MSRQLRVLFADSLMLPRICFMNFQVFLPVCLIAVMGGCWRWRDFGRFSFGPVLLVALALIGLYLLVEVENRYIAPSLLLVIIGVLAFSRIPSGRTANLVLLYGALLVFAGVVLTDMQTWARSTRDRQTLEGRSSGSYKRETWTAAKALITTYGIRPGDTVACYGEDACRDDVYWARLAQAQIRTEVFAEQPDVFSTWAKSGVNPGLIPALQSTGAKVLVGRFDSGLSAPAGWSRLGQGDLFVIALAGQTH